jgi:transcriptional regulator with XRE-family HTH domain
MVQAILLPERKRFKMPKPRTQSGEKNLISQRLIELRRTHNMSQRDLAYKLQLAGYDMDKNVITRIETNKRYVTDLELKAIAEIFQVSYIFLIERGIEVTNGEVFSCFPILCAFLQIQQFQDFLHTSLI